jgi:hypothetical protein
MIIGHIPAGYVLSKLLFSRLEKVGVGQTPFMFAGLSGAIAPDLDLFYFYLIDNRQHHHHSYFTHFPIVWIIALSLTLFWFITARSKKFAALAFVFAINGFFNLLLDSIVGDIWWLAPFVDKPFALFSVPALYNPWWLNFILHWSFLLELMLVAGAMLMWRYGSDFPVNAKGRS